MKEDFMFQHLETDEEVAHHLELMRSVFGQDSRVDLQVKKWIDHHPRLTLKNFFLIKHQGKMVACLNLIPSKWSIGGIPLKVAELACVATLPEYRHQGLQRRLMNEYHKQITEQGYDLSAIEGIPYYYRQFGYEYALPLEENTRIKLEQVPDYEIKHNIRPFTNQNIPKAMELLTQTQQKFYVHCVRDRGVWKMQQETGMVSDHKFEGYAIEENGEMTAYFRISEKPENKELLLREIIDIDQPMAQSILRFLKDIGNKRGLETLIASISYNESFIEHMTSIGGVKLPPYAWQIRIIDYVGMFQKMKPLFEKRLAASTYRHLTEKVNFNFYRNVIQVTFEDGVVKDVQRVETTKDRTIRFNPLVFTQLLLGYRNLEELQTIYPDCFVRPIHQHLVDVLFPKLPSYIHTDY